VINDCPVVVAVLVNVTGHVRPTKQGINMSSILVISTSPSPQIVQMYTIDLPDAVTVGEAYDGGGASPVGLH